MTIRATLCASILLVSPWMAYAQSDRVGGRVDERIGGRLNEGSSPQVRGLVGPDPYVGPGSVSPFTRAPVVPLRSAPIPDANPYTSRFPSTQENLMPQAPTQVAPVLQPYREQPNPEEQSTSETRPGAQPRQPTTNQRRQPTREKVGERLGSTPAQQSKENTQTPEAQNKSEQGRLVKKEPCVQGTVRNQEGKCVLPVR
jgi:hypothetical protein